MKEEGVFKIRTLLFCQVVLLAGLLMVACDGNEPEPEPADPYAALIDPTAVYQVIRGFGGATVFTPAGGLPNQSEMNALFGNSSGQIGLSILRIRVASDDDAAWRATERPQRVSQLLWWSNFSDIFPFSTTAQAGNKCEFIKDETAPGMEKSNLTFIFTHFKSKKCL